MNRKARHKTLPWYECTISLKVVHVNSLFGCQYIFWADSTCLWRYIAHITSHAETAAKSVRQQKAVRIQTSDGFYVDVDVSILYRIKEPYKVFTIIGPGKLFEDNGIIPKAEPALKETLGELTTEEFYNSVIRAKKAADAKVKLNEELEKKGIYVDHVLVRYFEYSAEIQKNIEEKKLKDQLVFKNMA